MEPKLKPISMTIVTHACLPIVVITGIEVIRHKLYKTPFLNGIQLFLIGVAGGLPDILWPHFSLYQRMHSWTHTIWFLMGLMPVVFLLARRKIQEGYVKFSILFWVAAMSHILLDSLSGGINLFYPIVRRIGAYYISYHTWIYYDIAFVCLLIVVLIQRKMITVKVPKS